jgi:hypothetical protein
MMMKKFEEAKKAAIGGLAVSALGLFAAMVLGAFLKVMMFFYEY